MHVRKPKKAISETHKYLPTNELLILDLPDNPVWRNSHSCCKHNRHFNIHCQGEKTQSFQVSNDRQDIGFNPVSTHLQRTIFLSCFFLFEHLDCTSPTCGIKSSSIIGTMSVVGIMFKSVKIFFVVSLL